MTKKISALTAASAAAGANELEINEAGTSKKLTLTQVIALVTSSLAATGYTATQIADKTHAVNTAGKTAGRIIYDSTNHRLMVAGGSSDTSLWYVADASASVTPS